MLFVCLIITVRTLHCGQQNRNTELNNLVSNTAFEDPWKQDHG